MPLSKQKRGRLTITMGTRVPESQGLPSGWQADQSNLGGVDLRLKARPRGYLAVGVGVLAVIAGWRTFAGWQITPGTSVAPGLGITLALSLLAVWCAFAYELWHLEPNYLAHRVGIGSWTHSRDYRDADLQIMLRFSTKWSIPYYRLYAIQNGESHFLLERSERELRQLASFISFQTGWRILPLKPWPAI